MKEKLMTIIENYLNLFSDFFIKLGKIGYFEFGQGPIIGGYKHLHLSLF